MAQVASSESQIKNSTLNAWWKNLWPEIVCENVPDSSSSVFANNIDLAHSIGGEGFSDLQQPDVEELFVEEEILVADLVDLRNQMPYYNNKNIASK